MNKDTKPTSRIFIGKLGAATKADLFKVCSQHGNILDFLMKEQYAFVVRPYINILYIFNRNMQTKQKPKQQ